MVAKLETRRVVHNASLRRTPAPTVVPVSRTAQSDPRWPHIVAALTALQRRGRHAVRIVDADCSCGTLLIEAMRHARALGFTAIEGRGIDGSPSLIGRARAAAARLHDPAIGVEFELGDMMKALEQEADFPPDIVLWHGNGSDDRPAFARTLASAGDVVIGDHSAAIPERKAA